MWLAAIFNPKQYGAMMKTENENYDDVTLSANGTVWFDGHIYTEQAFRELWYDDDDVILYDDDDVYVCPPRENEAYVVDWSAIDDGLDAAWTFDDDDIENENYIADIIRVMLQ